MPEVVLAVARFGFLALLWVFVFAVISAVRKDLFGVRSNRLVAAPRGVPGPAQRPAKVRRGKTARVLVVTEGTLAGTTVTLSDAPVTLGRADDSTLVLTDDYASTRHARLTPRAGQWLVEDLGSTNGTYLDRAKVTGPTPVPVGGHIRIGRTVLELRS